MRWTVVILALLTITGSVGCGKSKKLTGPPSGGSGGWMQTSGPEGGRVRALEVSGTSLFAGTYFGGVFRTTNNGASWTAVNNGLTAMDVHILAVSGTSLFAGTNGGVFRTTDNGASWTAVNNGLT